MSWSSRRQILIVLLILGVLALGAFLYLRPILTRAPSCTDGKQNGTETGVDCGGSCINFCSNEIKNPVILWKRSFPVTPSVYNAVAYIENQSKAGIQSLPYEFRLYDSSGIFVARASGTAIVPPLGRYAIVETGIKTGNATVTRTTFEFGTPTSPWFRIPDTTAALHTLVSDIKLTDIDTTPKLSALISNPSSTVTLNNTTVSAVLYDASDNAITASKTVVPVLGANVSVPVYFTWPGPITTPVVRYDIIPVIDVFHTTK